MYAPQARKTGGSSTIYSKAFADHITVDHIITADAKDYGFQEETVAHVVKDVYSKFRYVYPSKTKSGTKTCCTSLVLTMRSKSYTLIMPWSVTTLQDNCVLVTILLESMLTRTKQLLNVRSERSLRIRGLIWCNRAYPIAIGLWHHSIMLYASTSPCDLTTDKFHGISGLAASSTASAFLLEPRFCIGHLRSKRSQNAQSLLGRALRVSS